ncbi:hypothetical protein P7K49_003293, partial [Saguinus oedipus]
PPETHSGLPVSAARGALRVPVLLPRDLPRAGLQAPPALGRPLGAQAAAAAPRIARDPKRAPRTHAPLQGPTPKAESPPGSSLQLRARRAWRSPSRGSSRRPPLPWGRAGVSAGVQGPLAASRPRPAHRLLLGPLPGPLSRLLSANTRRKYNLPGAETADPALSLLSVSFRKP